MSTDFIGLFDVGVSAPLDLLLARLVREPPEIEEIVERYRTKWRPQSWTVEEPRADHPASLVWPGGFAIDYDCHMLSVYQMMPFGLFACDAESRSLLRRACLLIASVVESPQAIYTHEMMPHEGDSLSVVASNLRTQIGPAASTFEELRNAEHFGPRAWYIDDFTELRD